MEALRFPLAACLLLACVTVSNGISLIDTVKIEECVAGKYFWRASMPNTFYACLNNWPERAIKMKCSEGTYMCNTGEKSFKPCQCKGTPKGVSPDDKDDKQSGSDQVNSFAKMGDDANSILGRTGVTTPAADKEFPSDGCPDRYQKTENAHIPFGVNMFSFQDLYTCQMECLQTRNCQGIDWDRRPTTPNKDRCFFTFPESYVKNAAIVKGPVPRDGVDNYARTHCLTTPVAPLTTTSPDINGSTDDRSPLSNLQPRLRSPISLRIRDSDTLANDTTTTTEDPGQPMTTRAADAGQSNVVATNSYSGVTEQSVQATTERPYDSDATQTPHSNPSTTTIPDSGCPFTYQEYEGMSHPYGRNITNGIINDEVEECKQWCLVRGHCEAVDFNFKTATCYFLREINPILMKPVTSVTHYRKVDCEPPLQCWGETKTAQTSAELSVTDINTPMTECKGFCFVRQSMGVQGQVIDRGCVTTGSTAPAPQLGCRLDATLMAMVCYCDTPRCNGLSVDKLAAQMLYLPLDGDYTDHSGMFRDAVLASGRTDPQFTCLDKTVNCSALFMGDQCLMVPSLSSTQLLSDSDSVPKATFAIYFKRISGDSGIQGIFGNSVDNIDPTWRFLSGTPAKDYIRSGLRTEMKSTTNLDDFTAVAQDDKWHLAVMSYDGDDDITKNKFPTLRMYLDEAPILGNAMVNRGEIVIRNHPVSIGCVKTDHFVGFIDEVRIFNDVFTIDDVRALIAMKDVNFW